MKLPFEPENLPDEFYELGKWCELFVQLGESKSPKGMYMNVLVFLDVALREAQLAAFHNFQEGEMKADL